MSDSEISVFEGHYQDRYQKHSESVQAYDIDAQTAFENADVLPSTVPRETLGMPADQHEMLSQNRAQTRQMFIDNPKIKITEDGTHEVVPGAEGMEPLPARIIDETGVEVEKSYNDLTFAEQTQVQKMNMLEGMRRKRGERAVIDPDQVFDPDTGMNTALKVVAEIGEGLVEGLENTARSAAILGYDTFPPTTPFGAAMAEIMNSPAISTTDLRAGVLPDIKDQEGIGYGLTRGFAQFVPNFLAFNRALSGFTALKSANAARGFLAGMPADALAFDAVDGNLHDIAIMAGEVDVPGIGMVNLDNEYTQFMSASSQDTQAEGRLRNVIEGGLIGTAFEVTLKGLGKGYTKAQQSALKKKFVELYVGTAKNVRDFRNKAAGQLETNAMQALEEARTGELVEGVTIEIPENLTVKSLSEIALAKQMKGEVVDYDSWAKVATESTGIDDEKLLKEAFDNATEYMDAHNPAMQGRRAKQQEIDLDQRKGERRVDLGQRKRVADMSPEEMSDALLTSEKSVLRSERAYEEDARLEFQSFFDIDDFKEMNTRLTYEGADKVIDVVGQIMKDEAGELNIPYHLYGDEFLTQSSDEVALKEYSKRVQEKLNKTVVEFELPDGTIVETEGVGVSYGIGQTKEAAEEFLTADKAARKEAGIRKGTRGKPDEVHGQATGGDEGKIGDDTGLNKSKQTGGKK